jgi:hypothetical protein
MTTTPEFTEQEWDTMHKGVTGAGMYVALADRGFFDTFKEAGALGKHLAGARTSGESEVVRELAQRRGTGFGLSSSPEEVERETLEALRSSVATLEAKAPEEANAYRRFVVEVAESVAAAAGGGDTAESGALEKIRSVLGEGSAA